MTVERTEHGRFLNYAIREVLGTAAAIAASGSRHLGDSRTAATLRAVDEAIRDLMQNHAALQRLERLTDPDTGEVPTVSLRVLPTHYKCPLSGAAMPVENPEVWVYPENSNDPQESE